MVVLGRISRVAMLSAAVLLGVTSVAIAAPRGGSGNVTPSGHIGPLRLHRSTRADVLAFAGQPDSEQNATIYNVQELGYDCSTLYGQPDCKTTFYISLSSGKLIEFSTASVNYTAFGRIHIGTSTHRAEGVARTRATSGCLDAIYVLNRRAKITFTLMIEGGHGTPGGINATSHVVGGRVGSIVLDGGSDAIDCA
jgi:hypothetical protein